MPLKPEPVIARIVTRKAVLKKRPANIDDVVLFFPYDFANRGHITDWSRVGQHGETQVEYFHQLTRPARGPAEEAAVAHALAQYAAENEDFPVVPVQRLPKDWQQRAWKPAP